MATDLGAGTTSPVSSQRSIRCRIRLIRSSLQSLLIRPFQTLPLLPHATDPPSTPPNSRNMEATDSNFGLPTSHRVPPSKNPHPTTEKAQLDVNPQVNLNRAIGVEPTDRHSVQVRYKEVSTCCLMHCGFMLDATYTQWSPVT
jgi:hypothetical protein